MISNSKNARRDSRDHLLPALATFDQHILIVASHPATPHAIHASLLLPNASVFTSRVRTRIDFPTQVS